MFLYSRWLQLNINTRHKIAAQFNIKKRGSTEVVDNQVKNDGYAIKEVEESLNIDALQQYIGTNETDMMMLWMWLIEKIEGKELSQPRIDTTIIPKISDAILINPIEGEVKPKRGRKSKNA